LITTCEQLGDQVQSGRVYMQTDVSGPEAMVEFSAQDAISKHAGHQGQSGRGQVQTDTAGPKAMVKLSDQADNHEQSGPQGQSEGSQTITGQVTLKAMDNFSMPAKSNLENGKGLASHEKNYEMIVDLTMPDMQVSPREQVPLTTGALYMSYIRAGHRGKRSDFVNIPGRSW
jgi:hypothetical protein